MRVLSLLFVLMLAPLAKPAWALCSSYPYTLTNGTTADAVQVMANFNCAALTSGSAISDLTFTGTTVLPGNGRITSVGKVGIGTSSPNAPLDIYANSASVPLIALSRYNSAATVAFQASLDPGNNTFLTTTNADLNVVTNWNGGAPLSTMYLTSIGRVGVGTTSPSYTLHVNGSVAGTSAYNNLSDARLKKNIVPLGGGLVLVDQLQPVQFDWREPSERQVGKGLVLPTGSRQIGFIAQDLRTVLPEAVSTAKGKDAVMSVAESKIVPVLVSAVKELKAENDSQAVEIAKLVDQVAALQQKLRVQTARK